MIPVPARLVSHRIVNIGQAGVTPNVKHGESETTGRKQMLKQFSLVSFKQAGRQVYGSGSFYLVMHLTSVAGLLRGWGYSGPNSGDSLLNYE